MVHDGAKDRSVLVRSKDKILRLTDEREMIGDHPAASAMAAGAVDLQW